MWGGKGIAYTLRSGFCYFLFLEIGISYSLRWWDGSIYFTLRSIFFLFLFPWDARKLFLIPWDLHFYFLRWWYETPHLIPKIISHSLRLAYIFFWDYEMRPPPCPPPLGAGHLISREGAKNWIGNKLVLSEKKSENNQFIFSCTIII